MIFIKNIISFKLSIMTQFEGISGLRVLNFTQLKTDCVSIFYSIQKVTKKQQQEQMTQKQQLMIAFLQHSKNDKEKQ
jgi:hypothetical protein